MVELNHELVELVEIDNNEITVELNHQMLELVKIEINEIIANHNRQEFDPYGKNRQLYRLAKYIKNLLEIIYAF